MKKAKKIPQRKCIGCGEQKSKFDLIRVVKTKENQVFIDRMGKLNGRGAYLCDDLNCLEKAIKTKALNRSFEMEIDDKTYENLREEIHK